MNAQSLAPVVSIVDGLPVTTSKNVAEVFGKRHDHVLQKIRALLPDTGEWGVPNFRETQYTDPQNGSTYPAFELTRDGFAFIAGRFTGKKAAQFQIAYIAAFNKMEAALLAGNESDSLWPPRSATLLGTTIGTDGFRCLGAVLDGKLNKLPAKAKQRAKMHIWSQVHKAFSVVSAQDIPAEQMDSVRNFIAAYTLEGEWLAKADSTTTASTRRWLISRDHAGNEQRTPVPDDACVMSTRQMLDAIVRPGELGISTDEMHQFAMAALANLKMRLDNQSLLLKQMRASGLRA